MSDTTTDTNIVNKIKIPTVIALLGAGLTFAAGTGYTVLQTFDRWIDKKINSRIEPYEKLITGIALVQDAEYDDAVVQLEKSLNGLSVKDLDESLRKALIDHYMLAIVNSDDITNQEPDFNRLKEHLKHIPKYGWHNHQLGWYHLRTGKVDQAISYFEQALEKFNQHQEYRETADSYWALSITQLIKGDVDKAIKYTTKAELANPLAYSLDSLLKDKDAMKKDEWFAQLMRTYPTYGQKFDVWVSEVQKLVCARKT
ncbi:hypothetical protein [Photobacterium damselae]